MPINTTLGAAMVDVAGQAMLTHAIGQQASALVKARGSLEAMTTYASTLEGNIKLLCEIIERRGEHIDLVTAQRDEISRNQDALLARNQELEGANQELTSRLDKAKETGRNRVEMYDRQVEYMRDLKLRLTQTEKALRHSSGKAEATKAAFAFLTEATKAVENADGITEQALQIMERACEQFEASGRLTPDEETQKVLDELKIQAPDFKPGVAN